LDKMKTIIIIDDDLYIRRVLEVKLKNNGYSILCARDGQQGLQLIKANPPDVVITDINMPKINGKILCQTIEKWGMSNLFLTIVISARIDSEDPKWAAGFAKTLFIEKPFSPSNILDSIDQYFDHSKIEIPGSKVTLC
jgi:CheY-like chemotaxis protein